MTYEQFKTKQTSEPAEFIEPTEAQLSAFSKALQSEISGADNSGARAKLRRAFQQGGPNLVSSTARGIAWANPSQADELARLAKNSSKI